MNVRDSPAGEKLAQLANGHEVMEVSRRGDWIEVDVVGSGGLRGWIHETYLVVETTLQSPKGCLGVQKDEITGKAGQIAWVSWVYTLPTSRLCFHRFVEVPDPPKRSPVHWPMANIRDQIVVDRADNKEAPYDQEDLLNGDLYYGVLNPPAPTKVYRGEDEPLSGGLTNDPRLILASSVDQVDDPAQSVRGDLQPHSKKIPIDDDRSWDEKWTSYEGKIFVEDLEQTVNISIFLRSGYRDVSEGGRQQFEYFINIINSGDEVIVEYQDAPFSSDFFDELANPIAMRTKEPVFFASEGSANPPVRRQVPVEISAFKENKGFSALNILTSVYTPY